MCMASDDAIADAADAADAAAADADADEAEEATADADGEAVEAKTRSDLCSRPAIETAWGLVPYAIGWLRSADWVYGVGVGTEGAGEV
jgi:hypothetical protein